MATTSLAIQCDRRMARLTWGRNVSSQHTECCWKFECQCMENWENAFVPDQERELLVQDTLAQFIPSTSTLVGHHRKAFANAQNRGSEASQNHARSSDGKVAPMELLTSKLPLRIFVSAGA